MFCYYDNKRKIVNFKVADISELKLNQCRSAGTEFLYAAYSLHAYLHGMVKINRLNAPFISLHKFF